MGDRRLAVAIVGALLAGACVPPTAPDPPQTVPNIELSCIGNNACNSGGGNGGGGTEGPASCPAVTTVGNAFLGSNGVRYADLRPGAQRTLDTTPNNGQRLGACNDLSRVSWILQQAAESCRLNNSSTYTPIVTTTNVLGRCTITASIDGVLAREPIVIDVTAGGAALSGGLDVLLDPEDFDPARWVQTRTFVGRSAR